MDAPKGSHIVRSTAPAPDLQEGTCATCTRYLEDDHGCAAGIPVAEDRDVHAAIWCRYFEPRDGEA